MTKLTIKSIEGERQFQGKYGPGVAYKFIGEDEAGNLGTYDTFSKTIKEKLGQVVEGEVKENQYGRQFRPADSGVPGGFPKRTFGKTAEERREIIAQNAMSHATAITAALLARGEDSQTVLTRLPGLAKRIFDATLTIARSDTSPVNVEPVTEVENPADQVTVEELDAMFGKSEKGATDGQDL